MDVENIFRDVKLSKTEMTVLRFIQNDPEQCIRQGVRAVAEQCYSNPSSLVRLAKKLKFSGWLELVYFIKFNITMPKLDVTNDIDYMSVQPEEALTPLLASLKQQRILIHGSGFSQLIAQYIYTVFCKNGDITNPELSGGKMPDAGRNMTWDLRAPAPTPSHLRATVAIKGSFRGAEF